MTKKHSFIRFLSLLLLMAMMIGCLPVLGADTQDSKPRAEKSYEIVVAYDNSGSMYGDYDSSTQTLYESSGWYQAKYAVEIFASMMDLTGRDKLTIVPMHKVTVDGGAELSKIEVVTPQDIDKIHNMYTPLPAKTPYTVVTESYNILTHSNADEKWLVVLTDGDLEEDDVVIEDLEERFLELAKGDIKIQYIPFGGKVLPDKSDDDNFYASLSVTTEKELQDELITVCNKIFRRDVLKDRFDGQTLDIDLSMKKIVVFAQGMGADIKSLKSELGVDIPIIMNSGKRSYSNAGAGGVYEPATLPEELKDQTGIVVTFDHCEKGKYTLECSNAEVLQIFYEPDVVLEVIITDKDGNVIDNPEDFEAGEYTVTSIIKDPNTNLDVTNHELLGNGVDIKTKIKTSGSSDWQEYENGATIKLSPDSETDILVEGTYLEDYKIRSDENADLDWLLDLNVKSPTKELNVDMKVLQPGSWYQIRKYDKWKPIKVNLSVDGAPLTEEQMARVKFDVAPSGPMKYRYERVPGEPAYNVYLCSDAEGNYVETELGEYTIKAIAEYTNEYNEKITGEGEAPVTLSKQSKLWKILKIILIVLAILAVIVAWLIHPVLPRYMFLVSNGDIQNVSVRNNVTVRCRYSEQTAFSGKAKAVFETRNFWIMSIFKPARQSFLLTGVKAGGIKSLSLGGTQYAVRNGELIGATGRTATSIKIRATDIAWVETTDRANMRYTARIRINSRN